MRPRDDPEFGRRTDPDEGAEIGEFVFVGALGAWVRDVGKPLRLDRNPRQPLKLGGGQQPFFWKRKRHGNEVIHALLSP